MHRLRFTAIMLALVSVAVLFTQTGLAQSPAGQTRSIEWTMDIDAPIGNVWDAFTTKEGIESWMVPLAEVDLRVGGSIKTNYNPKGTIGDEGTIVHRILSLEPGRMISSRIEKSPAGFEHAKVIEQAWGITYFEPLGPNRTHLRLVSAGWGTGPEWDAAEQFFQEGNQWTLEQLRAKFADQAGGAAASQDPDAILDLARRSIGGEWIAQRPIEGGGTFRVRNSAIDGPDGRSLSSRGWLGDDDGMTEHAQTQVWREPVTDEIRFQNINERGDIARGAITMKDKSTMLWDWTATDHTGHVEHYRITMAFTGQDAYDMTIEHELESGAYQTMVELPFKRVAKAPAEFHRMAKTSAGG